MLIPSYGGSWVSGSSSYYDGSWLVSQSVETDRPVIYVGINYRLGYFGFPFGAEAQQEGASNLGQRDIIKALEWTRNNIAAFGGDPKRVTAYGESAGSVSVALLFLQPELDLFQNAIMQSGSPSTFPMGASGEVWLEAYDLLLELSGCQVGGNHTAGGFQCLKDLPAVDLLAAQTGVQADTRYHLPQVWARRRVVVADVASLIFTPSIDGDIVPASPHKLLAAGAFARKPFINGVMRDEWVQLSAVIAQRSNEQGHSLCSQPCPTECIRVDGCIQHAGARGDRS
jgi:carboxylesterase type B